MKEIIKLLENEGLLKRLKKAITVGGEAVIKNGGTSEFIEYWLFEIFGDNEELAEKFIECVHKEVAKEVEKELEKMEAPKLSATDRLFKDFFEMITEETESEE